MVFVSMVVVGMVVVGMVVVGMVIYGMGHGSFRIFVTFELLLVQLAKSTIRRHIEITGNRPLQSRYALPCWICYMRELPFTVYLLTT
jgi:hypothetical protein